MMSQSIQPFAHSIPHILNSVSILVICVWPASLYACMSVYMYACLKTRPGNLVGATSGPMETKVIMTKALLGQPNGVSNIFGYVVCVWPACLYACMHECIYVCMLKNYLRVITTISYTTDKLINFLG